MVYAAALRKGEKIEHETGPAEIKEIFETSGGVRVRLLLTGGKSIDVTYRTMAEVVVL